MSILTALHRLGLRIAAEEANNSILVQALDHTGDPELAVSVPTWPELVSVLTAPVHTVRDLPQLTGRDRDNIVKLLDPAQ